MAAACEVVRATANFSISVDHHDDGAETLWPGRKLFVTHCVSLLMVEERKNISDTKL